MGEQVDCSVHPAKDRPFEHNRGDGICPCIAVRLPEIDCSSAGRHHQSRVLRGRRPFRERVGRVAMKVTRRYPASLELGELDELGEVLHIGPLP